MAMIRKEIEIEAPVEQVWPYVATEAGLQQWWGAEILLEAKAGGHCEEKGTLDGVPYHHVGKVTCYDPPRQLTLAFQKVREQTWPAYTTISLTLTEADGRTTVTVVQQAHGFSQSKLDATPSDVGKPQSRVHPPAMRIEEGSPVAVTDTSVLTDGCASVRHGVQPDERVWQKRLETLKQRSQTA